MPNINLVLPQTDQAVARPVAMDIVKQIQELTKLPISTKILFAGDSPTTVSPGSALSDKGQDATNFLSTYMLEVSIEQDHDLDYISSTATNTHEHQPIFFDKEVGVLIRPVYSRQTAVINFAFRSMSKSAAIRFRDDLRMRVSMMRDVQLRDATYHYTLPKDALNILKEVHTLIEQTEGYGEDFEFYLQKHFTTRATKVSNQSGTVQEVAIAEKQMRIVGYFEFEGMPDKIEQDNDTATVTINFSYKFQYEKPIACNIIYPIIVHNSLIDERFIPKPAYSEDLIDKSFSHSAQALYYFEAQNQIFKHLNTNHTYRLPSHDEFNPKSTVRSSSAIFTALCTVDDSDPRALLNLRELGDIYLDPKVLEFIEAEEYPFIHIPYRSIFNISYYRGNYLMEHPLLEMDDKLNISCTVDLNKRLQHRVSFSVIADLDLVEMSAIYRLKKYPEVALKVLFSIAQAIQNNKGKPGFNLDGFITYTDIVRFLTQKNYLPGRAYQSLSKTNGANVPGSGKYLGSFYEELKRMGAVADMSYITDRPDSWYADKINNDVRRNTVMNFDIVSNRIQ